MAGIMAIMVITVMKSQNKLSGFINKKLIGFVIVAAIVLMGLAGFGNVAHAYTDEEKAQAKAWLSAHGYSPDAGGAAAAYQDYLNGKFDEELGIRERIREIRIRTRRQQSRNQLRLPIFITH